MDNEKLEVFKQEIDEDIKMTNKWKKLGSIFLAITGTTVGLAFGSLLGYIILPTFLKPALILGSISAMSYSFYEFYSKSTDSKLSRLAQEKNHLDNLESGTMEIFEKDNNKRKANIKEIRKEKAKNQTKMEKAQKTYFGAFTTMLITTVATAFNPYFAIVTGACFGVGHVVNEELNKRNKKIEELTLHETNLKRDMDLLGEPYEEEPEESDATNENTNENANVNTNTNENTNTNSNENTNSNTNGTETTQNNSTQSNSSSDANNDAIVTEIMGMPEIRELLASINSDTATEEEKERIVQAIVDIYSKNYNNSNNPKVNEKK